jgi:RimJ/RimL family protein N-acetyltransferase
MSGSISRPGISFEPCRPLAEQAHQIMTWRNDPTTLAQSYHHAPEDWAWFWPKFRDRWCREQPPPVLACHDGQPIGFLRFQPVPEPTGRSGGCVEISINLAPAARGRGLGRAVLRAAGPWLRAAGIVTVLAEVRRDNQASRRAFAAAGYRCLGPADKLVADTGELAAILRFVQELTP